MARSNPQRDSEALQLRAQGWSHQKIANELGYATPSGASRAVSRALARTWREPADEAKALVLHDLNRMKAEAWAVLETDHVVISNGRIVRRMTGVDDNGDPTYEEIRDDGPTLEAIDRILKINAEIAKVQGLYAPTRTENTTITLDQIDAELARLEAQLAANDDEGEGR